MVTARYILFVRPDSTCQGKPFLTVVLKVDGRPEQPSIQQQSGNWATYSFVINKPGSHRLDWKLQASDKVSNWKGSAVMWLTGQQQQQGLDIKIKTINAFHYRPMLPSPYSKGTLKKEILLGKVPMEL